MEMFYLRRLKQIYLNLYGNKSLLKDTPLEKVPLYVLVPPEPLRRYTALGAQEDPETFEEMLRRVFWQSSFQRKMIIGWLKK